MPQVYSFGLLFSPTHSLCQCNSFWRDILKNNPEEVYHSEIHLRSHRLELFSGLWRAPTVTFFPWFRWHSRKHDLPYFPFPRLKVFLEAKIDRIGLYLPVYFNRVTNTCKLSPLPTSSSLVVVTCRFHVLLLVVVPSLFQSQQKNKIRTGDKWSRERGLRIKTIFLFHFIGLNEKTKERAKYTPRRNTQRLRFPRVACPPRLCYVCSELKSLILACSL